MYTFTPAELEMLTDALNMSLQSNKRMQQSKPKFKDLFHTIEKDILDLRYKLSNPAAQTKNK